MVMLNLHPKFFFFARNPNFKFDVFSGKKKDRVRQGVCDKIHANYYFPREQTMAIAIETMFLKFLCSYNMDSGYSYDQACGIL